MDIQKIKELALANGFKLKEQADGSMDLNAYVYDFANAIEQAAKAQAIPDGFVLVPTTPNYEMWSGIARDLGRYMQMHNRYCPKSLKKYFDRFIGEIPEWLNKEVKDWDSDHAFATADLPAFIYMSMVEAARGGNE